MVSRNMLGNHMVNKMTLDAFTQTIQDLAAAIKEKPPEEASKIIMQVFDTTNLDVEQIQDLLSLPEEDISALQADVKLILQFAMESKNAMKQQLQEIKKYHKASNSYNNNSTR